MVDAQSVEVGMYAGGLLRLIGNEWISLGFFEFGFQDQQFTANFETEDCSGPFYVEGGPGAIPRSGITVLHGKLCHRLRAKHFHEKNNPFIR